MLLALCIISRMIFPRYICINMVIPLLDQSIQQMSLSVSILVDIMTFDKSCSFRCLAFLFHIYFHQTLNTCLLLPFDEMVKHLSRTLRLTFC